MTTTSPEVHSFDGRVAVVTGAGGGLGRCYALELARRGAHVVVNDLGGTPDGSGASTSAADAVVKEIEQLGGSAHACYESVATPEGGAAIISEAVGVFGGVDVLINNAGSLRDKSFQHLSFEDLEAILDVHLRGAFHVTQPAFRVMKQAGYGRILFTTSSAGLFGNFGQANYAAAKMGVVGLSSTLAIEGARYNITSNVVAPAAGTRLTKEILGDLHESFSPELVSPLVLYLVSEQCSLTHEVYSVGGGRFAKVFIGVSPGWSAQSGSEVSAEDVGMNIQAIRSEVGYTTPLSVGDELELFVASRAR